MAWVPNTKIQNQKSKSVISTASFNGRLHIVHLGDSSNDLWHSMYDGNDWTPNVRIPDQQSKAAPALAAFGGKLHMVHLGNTDNDLRHSYFDGNYWSPNTKIPNQKSKATPALASFSGKLHMVHLGNTDNDLWHSYFNGHVWSENVRIPDQKSKATPTLAAFGGKLHMVHLGNSENDLWHSTFNGVSWTSNVRIVGQSAGMAPAITAFEDPLIGPVLHLVYSKLNHEIWHSMFNGSAWVTQARIQSQLLKSGPAIAAFDSAVHLLHLDDSNNDIWHSWYQFELGRPITGRISLADGNVVYFERGCMFQGASTGNAVIACCLFSPRMGNPAIVQPNANTPVSVALGYGSLPEIPLRNNTYEQITQRRPALFKELWNNRLFLRPVGVSGQPEIPLTEAMRSEIKRDMPGAAGSHDLTISLRTADGSVLKDRQLYDLVFRAPGSTNAVALAPHCLYARKDWTNFSLAHTTDLHVSSRLESYRKKLARISISAESVNAFNNYNDNLRDFIRYANRLHDQGQLDGIMMTGDIIDYQFEKGEKRGFGGNFAFLEKMLLGKVPYPDAATGITAEELRVPVFMTLGNHDYRQNGYELFINAANLMTIRYYSGFNLTQSDAEALQGGGIINVSADAALDMVHSDYAGLQYYFDRLNSETKAGPDGFKRSSYVVQLGPHRLVMIDSAQDADVIGSIGDVLEEIFGLSNENERTFVQESPNSKGFTDADLNMVKKAIADTRENGVIIIGVHAPPVNTWGNEYPHYFRETEHATLDATLHQIEGYLRRRDAQAFRAPQVAPGTGQTTYFGTGSNTNKIHPSFTRSGTAWLKKGPVSELLDFNIAKDKSEEFLKLCAGVGQVRPVDLVLCGHAHYNVECRIKWTDADGFLFYTDFYTEHPNAYYKTQHSSVSDGLSIKPVVETIRYNVEVVDGAPLPVRPPDPHDHMPRLVPPYADELIESKKPTDWWKAHRPLIVQTAGLGPIETLQRKLPGATESLAPTFNGFRLITVKQNIIDKVRYVKVSEIR